MDLFVEINDRIQLLTIFAKYIILGVFQGYEYTANKSKQNSGTLSFPSQKIRTVIFQNFFHF